MSDRLGEKLRMLREQHGLTSRQLGEILGVGSSHVIKLEKGKNRPSIELLEQISRYFEVSADVLIKDELELEES
ncbi:helix-turn-helix transcriptional regulator [Anaerolineales bacterium HSG6]|nr:helix-turn-helix transcriptional regulator [Anaerolineales bacterium HSG6]